MESKYLYRIQESVSMCLRLIHMMFLVDRGTSTIILLCMLGDIFQDTIAVWINAQTHTVVQRLLLQAAPREQLVPQLIKLILARIIFAGFAIGLRHLRRSSEAKIKKLLRMTMTVKLLESFSSLDLVMQNDPIVLREFKYARELISGSVLSIANIVLSSIGYTTKTLILLFSILLQVRGRSELILLPLIGTLLGTEILILRGMQFYLEPPLSIRKI